MSKYNEMQLETNIQDDGQYEVQVIIKSKETEELDILLSGIQALIKNIGMDTTCEGDEENIMRL
jgi:predicted house-cleaning noncanonical NTP pyrophosphatase (MazG superfamily)